MSKPHLLVKYNNPLAMFPGHTVVESHDPHLPVAIVFSNPEATEESKAKMAAYARLFGQATEMKSDISNFCAAMRGCQTKAEAAKIAKDFHALFCCYL